MQLFEGKNKSGLFSIFFFYLITDISDNFKKEQKAHGYQSKDKMELQILQESILSILLQELYWH